MSLDPILRRINQEALSELHDAWQSERLCVCIGAGASVQSGLPSWNALLQEMIIQYIEQRYKGGPLGYFTGELRERLNSELGHLPPIMVPHYLNTQTSPDDFINLVHNALYKSCQGEPEPSDIHKAVARLGARINSIVAFNFDNLLEAALNQEGHENTSVWKANHWGNVRGIPVYHPHGYLPYHRTEGEHYRFTLSEAEYHTQFGSPYHWSNVVILKSLLETTCLFVSASLTDPNLRRLLDFAHRENPHKYHFFIWSRLHLKHMEGATGLVHEAYEDIFVDANKRLGLRPVWFFYEDGKSRWDDIPQLVDCIRERRK